MRFPSTHVKAEHCSHDVTPAFVGTGWRQVNPWDLLFSQTIVSSWFRERDPASKTNMWDNGRRCSMSIAGPHTCVHMCSPTPHTNINSCDRLTLLFGIINYSFYFINMLDYKCRLVSITCSIQMKSSTLKC